MKKMIFVLAVLLVAASATTYVYSKNASDGIAYIVQNNIETLSSDDMDGSSCFAGGPRAVSCSLGAGVGIGGATGDASCTVTCSDGYYACCGVGCKCIKN